MFRRKRTIDFDTLFKQYNSYVYKIVINESNHKLTKEDIEETVSDIFFLLWKNHEKINDYDKIKSYIATIAKNATRNKLRSLKQEFALDENSWVAGKNDDVYHVNEQLKIVQEALHHLDVEDREIFLMYYYDNMKIKDIAKTKAMNISTVKTRLHRVKKKMKRRLEK